MSRRDPIFDKEIQDFIDDRLDRCARSAVIARLLADPQLGAEVEALRRQQDALRQLGQATLNEPVPPRLRSILQRAFAGDLSGGGGGSRSERFVPTCGLATAMALVGCVARSLGL